MGASRENMSLWNDLKKNNWKGFRHKLKLLFKRKETWSKEMIIKDSFITPFNKIIGCRMFGHKWSTDKEMVDYDLVNKYCWKCSKYTTIADLRNEKISKLIK